MRHTDSSTLGFSLATHRHSELGFTFDSRFIVSYKQQCVNCVQITRDVEKIEPLTDGFTYFSDGTKDHEHLYTVYEYKYHLIAPGTMLIHSERSRRHDNYKISTKRMIRESD